MKWDAERKSRFCRDWNDGLERDALAEKYRVASSTITTRVRTLRAEGWPLKSRQRSATWTRI